MNPRTNYTALVYFRWVVFVVLLYVAPPSVGFAFMFVTFVLELYLIVRDAQRIGRRLGEDVYYMKLLKAWLAVLALLADAGVGGSVLWRLFIGYFAAWLVYYAGKFVYLVFRRFPRPGGAYSRRRRPYRF